VKRLLLPVLALAFGALAPQMVRAQSTLPELLEDGDQPTTADSSDGPQRIGIPAATFDLSPSESAQIAGYCFDEHLIAPTRVTSFDHILAGAEGATVRTSDGRAEGLREAIRNGDVAVRAQQLTVAFTNRSGGPIELRLARPTVLWDRPAGSVNPLALAALDAPNASYDARQRAIWRVTSAERRLQALGYPTGSIYNFDAARMKSAMNAFQRDNGLPETSELDLATIERINTVDAALRSRLRALGFQTREARFARENLGSQIRACEKFLGLPQTGRWTSDLAARVASTERLVPQLNGIRPAKGQQIADVLATSSASDVLSYIDDGRTLMLLTQAPAGIELWSRAGRAYQFGGRDADALRAVDRAAATLASRASKNGRIVLYAGIADGATAPVTIGGRSVDVDARELAAFVAGGAVPKALDAALAPMLPQSAATQWTGGGGGPAPTIVVYHGPLQQGGAPAALDRMGLAQADGVKLAAALDRTYGARMSLYVSDDLRVGAEPYEQGMGSLGADSALPRLASAE
jgi:peptidoglycan hydrolase-like protein with peptidoglycan-binding domain